MKKIFENIKYIKISDFFSIFIFIIAFFCSIIFRLSNKLKRRKLWLICENGKTARDNGYYFYKYIRKNYPDDFCFYVIDKNSNDYDKVKKLKNIIQFKSLKHWIYYLSAEYNLSNHKNGNPSQTFFYLLHVTFGLYNNRVFLQHGITKDDAKWLYYKNTKFSYFVCGARREYEFVKKKFGYPEGNLIYTGFPRFDNLHNIKINSKQILFMPTWRNWIGRETNILGKKQKFIKTDFYNNWNKILNNKKLINFLETNDFTIYFYPHIEMQKYLNFFKSSSDKIKILDSNNYDIQKLLKESLLLVTDYSSVYMDFAYMKKPIIYFQFDYEEYRKRQYQDGYFNYQNDGFGPIYINDEELTNGIIKILMYGIEKKYAYRMDNFFEIRDMKNCERIYKILKKED